MWTIIEVVLGIIDAIALLARLVAWIARVIGRGFSRLYRCSEVRGPRA